MWEYVESLYNLKNKHKNKKSVAVITSNSSGILISEPTVASDKGEQKLDRRTSLILLY